MWDEIFRFWEIPTQCLEYISNRSVAKFVKHRYLFDFPKKSNFRRLHLWSHSFSYFPRFMTVGEDGDEYRFKYREFAFLDSFCFKTTERCKAHIAALALLIHTSNSSSCLSSVEMRRLYTWTAPPAPMIGFSAILQRTFGRIFRSMDYLSFGSANFYSSNVTCSRQACWRRDLEEAEKLNHLRKATDFYCIFRSWHTYHFGWVCQSSSYVMKRSDDKAQPCRRLTTTWKDFDCLLFTRKQASGWTENDLMAINICTSQPYSCSTLQSLF